MVGIGTNIQFNEAEYQAEVNRSLAADIGVNITDITNALAVFTGDYIAGKYYYNDYPYNIIVSSHPNNTGLLHSLQNIYVPTSSGSMVPLSSFLTPKLKTVPTVLSNYNQVHALHIMANLKSGYSTSSAIESITNILKSDLPHDVSYSWFGQTKNYIESSSTMLQNLALGIIFIYLFLAAQFGSFKQPLIILLSIPLTLTGALFALYISNISINIFSQIGLITLLGLISKHGILITEFANQLRKKGLNKKNAIMQSVQIRLKPILMTTAAMFLGALPLVFSTGAGYEYGQQLGIVIIGGLIIGTITTLIIVPAFYMMLVKENKV